MKVILWRSSFQVLDAVYYKGFIGRYGLGHWLMWGPTASNGYPWLWVKYDVTLRPWMAKRKNAARERWRRAYQRARWGR